MNVTERLDGALAGPGTFRVPSASMPGETWTVHYQSEGAALCYCPGFAHRQKCRHVEAVERLIKLEARALRDAATPESRAEAEARLIEIT